MFLRAFLVLLLLTASLLLAQAAGDFPAKIVDKSGKTRHELYPGEDYYIYLDLRKYSGYVHVVFGVNDTFIGDTILPGGREHLIPMSVGEDAEEGKVYVLKIDVYRNAFKLGSARVPFVTKYCPDFELVDVKWGPFIYGNTSRVEATVRNKGESRWTYTIEVSSANGTLKPTSRNVAVGANSTAKAELAVPVVALGGGADVMRVRVSCAGGKKSRLWEYPIAVLMPRPGPLVAAAGAVEARLGVESKISITLRNLGLDVEVLSVSLGEGRYRVDAPGKISAGSKANLTIYFTPEKAGVYNLTLKIRYKSPTSGAVYEDVVVLPLKVYARLLVRAIDHLGRPVPILNGTRSELERWALPGRYSIKVPAVVEVNPNERLVFSKWSTGAVETYIEVDLNTNTEISAVYNREYKIVLDLSPVLQRVETWVKEGDVFAYAVPKYVEIAQDVRWALGGFAAGAQNLGGELRFEVRGPMAIRALWHKEYKIVIDCGEARCVEGSAQYTRWVKEGETLHVKLADIYQAGERVRFRLLDSPDINIAVREPLVIKPKYVKEFYVKFGYKIKTEDGVVEAKILYGEWLPENNAVSIPAGKLMPPTSPKVRYELAGYEVDGSPAAPQVNVKGPHDIYAVWDKYYLVEVITPIGTAGGGGWYKAGSVATISLSQSASGFLIYDRFMMWVSDDGRVYNQPTITLRVDQPITLTAVWEKDYTQALVLAGGVATAGVAFWARKKRTKSETRRVELEELEEEKTKTWGREEKE